MVVIWLQDYRVVEVPAKEIAVAMSEIIHQILDAVKRCIGTNTARNFCGRY